MKSIRSKNSFYFLLAIVLTTSLMLLNKSNFLQVLSNQIPRNLLEKSKKDYVCNKAGSRLTDKYKSNFNEEGQKKKNLSNAQKSLVDFISDQTYSNIKPYIKHLGIFIFFLVLDIILIFIWISYCSCCCCSCCLFKTAEPNRFCSCLFFFIAMICNLIVFIISIIILGVIKSFFSRLNGLGCSAYYFLDHVQDGLAPSYTNHQSEWEGINGLIYKIEKSQSEAESIQKKSDGLYSEIQSRKDSYSEETCKTQYDTLITNTEEINNLIKDSFEELRKRSTIDDLRDASSSIEEAEDDAGDTIYDVLHGHINKYVKRIIIAIFTLTLIFSLLALLSLGTYIFFRNNIIKIVYIVIWNISMLLMLLSILAGVVFGIIGYLFSDAVQVGQYILSSENLNSTDPIVFESGDKTVSNLIDTCANGDGNFTQVVNGGEKLNSNLENWKTKRTDYETSMNAIKCDSDEKTIELKGYYTQLINIIDRSLDITYNITNVTCSFAKNDKNIFLNEADSGGNKGIGLCACSFLIGIFLGISVLAGIILVHRYQLPNSTNGNGNLSTTNIQDSRENVGQEIHLNNNTMNYPK